MFILCGHNGITVIDVIEYLLRVLVYTIDCIGFWEVLIQCFVDEGCDLGAGLILFAPVVQFSNARLHFIKKLNR